MLFKFSVNFGEIKGVVYAFSKERAYEKLFDKYGRKELIYVEEIKVDKYGHADVYETKNIRKVG